MFSQRINTVRLLIYVSFIPLIGFLFYFQVLQFRYYKDLSVRNAIRLIPIEASRGTIFDRNKNPIAIDKLSFDLVVVPQEVKDIHKTLGALSKSSGISKDELLSNYRKNYTFPFAPVKLVSDIEREKAFYIEEDVHSAPGALIWAGPRRYYPDKEASSHIAGYLGRIQKDEFEALKDYGYRIKDLVGKSGIERYYDSYLRGEDGGIQIEVDARSREIRRLGFKEPRRGKDLRLTIDSALQNFTYMLLKEKKGACIVMDAKRGGILTLVSSASFDPNIFISGSDSQRLMLLEDASHPMLNRAISCAYPPGSTFKIVVATGGVAEGIAKPNVRFFCDGTFNLGKATFRCWKEEGHGSQDIIEGLTHSCNVFFYNLGRILGAEQLHRYAVDFGLGSLTGIDLPQETKGLVPSPLWKRFFLNEVWREGDTINYSIGQGYLLTTPIQMLRAVTIIANEGFCPQPYLVEEIDSRAVSHKQFHSARLKKDVFKVIKKGMFNVVNDPTGTGQNAKSDIVKIAGKTGTAQPGEAGDTHAWFVGYLPADNPEITLVLFIEHGGQGGVEPAYMARLIGTYLKENGFLK